jgi:Ca-activated chloride channel family protein
VIRSLSLLLALSLAQAPVLPEPATAPSRVSLAVDVRDAKGEIPRNLTAADFIVREDTEPRPVVDFASSTPPWRVVIYIDRVLTGSRTLRGAAGSLAERSRDLVALGPVDVIVAEPEPRVLLEGSRDAAVVDDVLSRLWLSGEGRDDLRALRQRFVEQLGAGPEAGDPVDLMVEAIDNEARLARIQQDHLAEWLLRQPRSAGPQALFLVSDGFDVDPGAFYRSRMPTAAALGGPKPALETAALETARTASFLGWTVFPLPVGDPGLPDLRVRPQSSPKLPIGVTVPLGRKPKEEAKRPALPNLSHPQQPLGWLAEATGGALLVQPQGIAGALGMLRSRVWLTYETPRAADGRTHAVEVGVARPDVAVRARRWDGAGLPEAVALARALRLLEGEDEGDLEVVSKIQPEATPEGSARRGTLNLRVESPDVSGPLRLTVAAPDSAPVVSNRQLTEADLVEGSYRVSIPIPEGAERLAVLVEPASGGWGGDVIFPGAWGAEAAGEEEPISTERVVIRLAAPAGSDLTGKVRLRATGAGEEIARVELKVGDRRAAGCAALPCEAEVDLGRRVRAQTLEAVAYAADGRELARDAVRVNDPGEDFRIRITEPAGGMIGGAVDVAADVRIPAAGKLDRVEFFWNDQLAATLYTPPFRHRIVVPRDRPSGYLRVAARLTDGSTAEDAVTVNASGLGERVDVRLVELFVVVTDGAGKPVKGLSREAFHVRQDGRDQEIASFENAGDLPLTVALAIDSSASMFLKLPKVQDAVASLLNGGLSERRDRALLVDFDTQPRLVRSVTRDLGSVSSSLAALSADGGTALWEAISFSLTQLQGLSGRKALVVYSDGIEEGSRISYREVLSLARKIKTPVYLIVANPRAARGEDGGFLEEPISERLGRLAEATGGKLYFALPDQDLSAVYQEILSELRSQYVLSFYPRDLGPRRDIKVEVEGRGLTARTMSGTQARP